MLELGALTLLGASCFLFGGLRQCMTRVEQASRKCSESAKPTDDIIKTMDISQYDVSSLNNGIALLKTCAMGATVDLWVQGKVLLTRRECSLNAPGPDDGVKAFIDACGEIERSLNEFLPQALDVIAAVICGVSGLKSDAFPGLRDGTAVRGLIRLLKTFKARAWNETPVFFFRLPRFDVTVMLPCLVFFAYP